MRSLNAMKRDVRHTNRWTRGAGWSQAPIAVATESMRRKIETCLECRVFEENVDADSGLETLGVIQRQFKEFRSMIESRDRELESLSMELSIGLSEVFDGLKRLSAGDPAVRISENSEIELIVKLKRMVNSTGENLKEIIDQSHEFAMGLAEHFDVLNRAAKGDLTARSIREFERGAVGAPERYHKPDD